MAIFNQSNKNTTHTGKSIISNGCSIRGEIELTGDCHIDGNIEGNIFSQYNVSIGQTGHVTGFILAQHIVISGKFNGQIDCDFLEIQANGEANGDLKANRINFEIGSRFTGYSHDDSKAFYRILPEEVKSRIEQNQLTIDANPNDNPLKLSND